MKFILITAIFFLGLMVVSGQSAASVAGKVKMGGLPVADATVTAASDAVSGPRFTTQSKGDGSYQFAVPPGRYFLFANKGVGRTAAGCGRCALGCANLPLATGDGGSYAVIPNPEIQ